MDLHGSAERLETYRRRSTTPMLMVGLLYMAALVATLADPDQFTSWLITTTWIIFIVDYAIQVFLAPVKWKFVTHNIPMLVALVIPPWRIILLIPLADRAFRSKDSNLRGKIGLAATYIVAITLVMGSLFVYLVESNAPGANITTYGESLWWGAVTITTVGYGDYTPVTVTGRVIASGIFAIGICLIAVLSASTVSLFTDAFKRERHVKAAPKQESHTKTLHLDSSHHPVLHQMMEELSRISARLERIETRGIVGQGLPDADNDEKSDGHEDEQKPNPN